MTDMVHLIPMRGRIIVRPDEQPTESPGGILLPKDKTEVPVSGTVVAVGPPRLLDDGTEVHANVEPGDRVVYGKFATTEIPGMPEPTVIIGQWDILAKESKCHA